MEKCKEVELSHERSGLDLEDYLSSVEYLYLRDESKFCRKAPRTVIDTWLVAHSISQPPSVAGAALSLVAATGTIAASTVIPSAPEYSFAASTHQVEISHVFLKVCRCIFVSL